MQWLLLVILGVENLLSLILFIFILPFFFFLFDFILLFLLHFKSIRFDRNLFNEVLLSNARGHHHWLC